MGRTAIMTDSNSGIRQAQAKELGVCVLPMPILLDGEQFFEEISISQEMFYERLAEGCNVSTSQPSVGDVLDIWDELLKEYDEVVHIPMSSGLSAAYGTAEMLAQDYNGRVQVVNNQQISVTQRNSVMDALEMAKQGWSALHIKERLEETKFDSEIYIMVDTLKYLQKGGRLTPAAAAIGAILQIKPVLQIQGEKLDAFAKAYGTKQAKKLIIEAIKRDFATRFVEVDNSKDMRLFIAYSHNLEAAQEFKEEVRATFAGFELDLQPLPLSVASHIGPGALALACSRRII